MNEALPEADEINYVSRVTIPVLMLCGRYDTVYPYDQAIRPMYDLLGTPIEQKVLKLYESDHIAPKVEYVREILAWLDPT